MLRLKGFIPYIFIVFFNSFVDLGHKILIQNTLYQSQSAHYFTLYSSIVNALILLPYILLFTPSGFIADKYSKTNVLRVTALLAVPILIIITWSYYAGYFKLAFLMTLMLAVQSVINSPAKYGYIKEMFGKESIARANAFVQTTVIIAILAGTFVFSVIFDHYLSIDQLQSSTDPASILQAFAPAGFILIGLSLAEVACTFIIPKKSAVDPQSRYIISNYFRGIYLKSYMQEVFRSPTIFVCILGLSLFWAINQVLLASYGAYLKDYAGDPSVVYVQGALGIGGIGILIGASYAGRVSRGFIETGMIPFAAMGLSAGLLLLPLITGHLSILILFFIYGFFGGMLVVPLNALVQFNARDSHLGKVLAANNFVQTIFMLVFLAINIIYTILGGNIRYFLVALFVVSIVATLYAVISYPQYLLRYLVYFVISKFYRIQVYGLDNMPSTEGVLLLGNHTSYLDWALIQITSPRPIRFVMERRIFQKWYLKWVLAKLKMIPISRGGSKDSIEKIQEALKTGDIVVLFPEGRLSRNGQLGEFNNGFERAVAGTGASIIPFYLRGLWGTSGSYATSRYKKISWVRQRRISINYGEALPDNATVAMVKQRIMLLSIKAWKRYTESLGTISEEWLRRVKQLPTFPSIIDSLGVNLTNAELLAAVMAMTKSLGKLASLQNIGIILPAGAGGVIANLSVLCLGKTVVNLNYTSNHAALTTAINQSEISTIITSQVFIKKLEQKGYDLSQILNACSVFYLEDFKAQTTKFQMVMNYVWVRILPLWLLKKIILTHSTGSATAAILFSSGSEGMPKGVELTHRNILGNAKQISSIFNIEDNDIALSCLPLFHAFGLTATTIMPLVEGTPMVCHADPTDVVNIAKLIYHHKVTFLCGTSTLFSLYCRNKRILTQMLSPLRLIIAGAEKLNPSVRDDFKSKFNQPIYEGYGTTEVAPVASTNLPDMLDDSDWCLLTFNRIGTVGLPLPGTAFKIVDPQTLSELPINTEGMVLVGGTQVMRGYLKNPEKTAAVLIPEGDITWYITGDKGRLDEDGYLTIVDRYSRFAKIGGEMISLSAVESALSRVINTETVDIMAVAVLDEKRGEKIVILHTGTIDAKTVRENLSAAGVSNLYFPAEYLPLVELPKLGSGKKDYSTAKKLAEQKPDN